jgi:ankyrin repeat protein
MRAVYGHVRLALTVGTIVGVVSAGVPAAAQIGIDIYQRAPVADAAARGDANRMRGYMTNGQSPNSYDIDGRPAVMLAAIGNYVEVMEALVDAKARCDATDKIGTTALLVAADRGYDQIIEQLIRCKANLNLENRQAGLTPLMLAAQKGHLRSVQILVQAGANLNIQDRTGRTALEWAEINNRRSVADFLRRSGAKS